MVNKYCETKLAKWYSAGVNRQKFQLEEESDWERYIDTLVVQMSGSIDRYCNQPDGFFAAGGISITEYFDGKGSEPESGRLRITRRETRYKEYGRKFSLSHRPVISLTSVKERTTTTTWTARTENTDFIFQDGEIYFIKSIPSKGWKNVEIVYKAGYAATPSDIERACALLVRNHLLSSLEDFMTASVEIGRPGRIEFGMPTVFTKDVEMLLNKYRRVLPIG